MKCHRRLQRHCISPPTAWEDEGVTRRQHDGLCFCLCKPRMPLQVWEEDIHGTHNAGIAFRPLAEATRVLIKVATLLGREQEECPSPLDLGEPGVRAVILNMQPANCPSRTDGDLV